MTKHNNSFLTRPLSLSADIRRLKKHFFACDINDIWWLAAHITKTPESTIKLRTAPLTEQERDAIASLLERHLTRYEPIAYLIGSTPFAHLTLSIKPPVLIPRPETEEYVVSVRKQLRALPTKLTRILDMGTGSGAIALTLADCATSVVGIDISADAIALAEANATRLGIKNCQFVHDGLAQHCAAVAESGKLYDMVISNPPYISHDEWESLDYSVREWEDYQALCAADDGLAFYKFFAEHGEKMLSPDRTGPFDFVLEYGYRQREALTEIFESHGHAITHHTDLSGNDRWCTVVCKSRRGLQG